MTMTVTIQLKKKCKRCKQEKFLNNFYMRRARQGGEGRHSYCIKCEKQRNKANYCKRVGHKWERVNTRTLAIDMCMRCGKD